MKKIILTAKLTPPTPSRHAVYREAICDRVFASFESRVVLVRAPAGFGKTTAMAQMVERYRQEGTTVLWITLDESDNDFPRFLSYLALALKAQLDIEIELERHNADSGALEGHLFSVLNQSHAPIALFFDEVEVIRDPTVLAFIRQLIARLPANARLVMGSRSAPDIGLGRLRAHGQLVEIVPEQLRFSVPETDLFLRQRRGLELQPEQVRSLQKSTEGWPTALWLASVALERRTDAEAFIAGFAGSDITVSDYLAEDVLVGQPPEIREFLLETSILQQLDAPLCDAVCGRGDSAAMLERLVRDNLFLTPIDERGHYRYHSLFRGFLQAQLARRGQPQVAALHRAAAQWFLGQQRPIPAIDHALEAGDFAFAVPLMSAHAETLLGQGRLRLLTRWFETLPGNELEQHPHLRLMHIWAVNLSRGPQEALAMLGQIDPASLTDAADRAQFHALQPTLLGMRDRIDESHALGLERLQLLKPENGFPYAMLAQTLANDSMILGDYAGARRYADQAQSVRTGELSVLHAGLAGAVNGAIDLMQGRLRQATAELRIAAGIADDNLLRNGGRHVLPGVLFAETLYEAGRWNAAEELLSLFVPLAQSLGLPDQLILAHTTLARLAERQDQADRVLELLTQLESLGHRLGLPRVVASARIEKANALLARGDIRGAESQLRQAGENADWHDITARSFVANDKIALALADARWKIRSGSAAQALAPLKQQLADAEAGQRQRRALKLQILLAEALAADGQHKLAMRTLSKALDFGAGEGFVGSFIEEGARVQDMLHELLRTRQNEANYHEGDPLGAHLARMIAAGQKTAPASAPVNGPIEALTRKELQILELVGQGLTNDSMAQKLFVSESTIRTHLRSINTKLQASNRMHAVALARQMQLIP